jgi:hypothetical protein
LRSAVAFCAAFALIVTAGGSPPAPLADEIPEGEQHLLLLKNGRVVEGRISSTAGGYFVETSTGNMVIPFSQVSLEAADLPDVYEKQRKSMKFPTASMHLALAAWCVNHDLFEQARTEVKDALRLEPDRPQARRMLIRIEKAIDPKAFSKKRHERRAPAVVAGYELPPVQTLAGLPREAARDFTRRIQPLMLNKCGNATCHGENTRRGFRLFPVRHKGESRTNSQRNLAAILAHVNVDNPDASPLLLKPQGTHGGMRRSLFSGQYGKKQLEVLRGWIRHVAASGSNVVPAQAELHSPKPGRPPEQSDRLVPVVVSRETAFPKTAPQPQPLDDSSTSDNGSTSDAGQGPDGESLRELLRSPPVDAFDPSEFNRRAGSG